MVFAEFQKELMDAGWKQKAKYLDPLKHRKGNWCPKCGKQGFKAKMELMKDGYTTMNMARYKVEIFGCPRCHWLDKQYKRIEGKGKSGVNLGREYGGI